MLPEEGCTEYPVWAAAVKLLLKLVPDTVVVMSGGYRGHCR